LRRHSDGGREPCELTEREQRQDTRLTEAGRCGADTLPRNALNSRLSRRGPRDVHLAPIARTHVASECFRGPNVRYAAIASATFRSCGGAAGIRSGRRGPHIAEALVVRRDPRRCERSSANAQRPTDLRPLFVWVRNVWRRT
jgi:hypothetical protein